jgi:hypothetical protein
VTRVRLETSDIVDWPSFHDACQRAFGFPGFYGRNMDAWIDCMSSLRADDGLVAITIGPDEVLHLEVPEVEALSDRMPEITAALVECSGFVNRRYLDRGETAPLALVFT